MSFCRCFVILLCCQLLQNARGQHAQMRLEDVREHKSLIKNLGVPRGDMQSNASWSTARADSVHSWLQEEEFSRSSSYLHSIVSNSYLHFIVIGGCALLVLLFMRWSGSSKDPSLSVPDPESAPILQATREDQGMMKAVVFPLMILFGVAHTFAPHVARDMNYNFLCPVILISLLKAFFSLLLHIYEDGCYLSHVFQTCRDQYIVVLKYGLQSSLWGMYDVLCFVNLKHLEPSTYAVLMQFRLVVTAIMWEVGFQKSMSTTKRISILLITIACCLKQLHKNRSISDHWSTVLIICAQILAGCLATVTNEMLLKKETQVSMNVQNTVQYIWTIFWAILIGFFCLPLKIEGLSLNPFDVQEWGKMMDMRMLPSVIVLSLNGLVVARVLRFLSSLWKSIGNVIEIFLISGASSLIWGYQVVLTDWISYTVLAVGILLFSQA